MKKNILIIIGFISVIIAGYFFVLPLFLRPEKIFIALAGPLSKEYGKSISAAVNLCIEKVNLEGGINGRKIEILPFDDDNDKKYAVEIAEHIASENKALVVLGHYYSGPSVAAGKVYKNNEIPVITGGATAEAVTENNNWYFRTIPNNRLQASFIANYIYRTMSRSSVSIVIDLDDYGLSLAKSFENAAGKIGVKISKKWDFDRSDPNIEARIKQIAAEVIDTDEQDTIFFATHTTEGAKIITALRDAGKKHLIFGPDAFASIYFCLRLKEFGQQGKSAADYADGVYCVSPYVGNIASDRAYAFEQEFFNRFGFKPSWEAACFYDAACVAIEAIKRAGIRGKAYIREDRRKVRQQLAGFYSPDNALAGITGQIYFDENGDISRPYAIVFYRGETLLPSFFQYQQIPDIKNIDNVFEKVLCGDIMVVDGKYMNRIQIVYAGIYINEIKALDVKNSTYKLDLHLWFRFRGDFKDANIEIINLVSQEKHDDTLEKPDRKILGMPIIDETKHGITTRVYRINEATLKTEFDFHPYPFDRHMIRIGFRHAEYTRDELIYVPDAWGMPESIAKLNNKKNKIIQGWNISDNVSYYEDIVSKVSTLGNPRFFDFRHVINFSRFNAEFLVQKSTWQYMIVFMPVFFLAAILWLICFLDADRLPLRMLILTGVLIMNAFCHMMIILDIEVEYITFIEYAIFVVYILVIIFAFLSILIFRARSNKRANLLRQVLQIIYPFIVLGGTIFIFI